MIAARIEKRFSPFTLDVELALGDGVTALLGPSGSGKTTILNLLAGLVRPDRGTIIADGKTLFDSAAGIDMPAHRRAIGYVFQDLRLFPHLNVGRNLDYGRFMSGQRRDEQGAAHLIELLGIGHLLQRRPATLSGGEAARVAIARALLAKPRLLLLDEPLAALDTARKDDILPYLERLAADIGTPMIYVSHAEAEVRRLAQRIVRIERGRVVGIE